MKRFMMSDIHGFYEAFETALNKVDFSGENQLFLLGDYIDYGPDSRKVLEKIKALQEIYGSQKVITLMGNHEKALLDWLEEYADINRHICGVEQYRDAEWLLSDADGDYGTLRSFLSARHFREFTEKEARLSGDSQKCRGRSAAPGGCGGTACLDAASSILLRNRTPDSGSCGNCGVGRRGLAVRDERSAYGRENNGESWKFL